MPFPEPCDKRGEVLHTSQELLDTLLLQQGNLEQKPEIGEYSSAAWLYSFPVFPSASVPGRFLTWTLVLATEAVFTGQQANISHNTTLLYPLTTRGRNLGATFNASRLSVCTSSKVPKIQIILCFLEKANTSIGSVLLCLTPGVLQTTNERFLFLTFSSHLNDEIVISPSPLPDAHGLIWETAHILPTGEETQVCCRQFFWLLVLQL